MSALPEPDLFLKTFFEYIGYSINPIKCGLSLK